MPLLNRNNPSIASSKPVHLTLSKERTRSIKRGHAWTFSESLVTLPSSPDGSLALLKDKDGDILAKGYYEPSSRIAFRTLALGRERLDDSLIHWRLERALSLRRRLFSNPSATNGFRLVNGEGDFLPGLIVDIYGHAAVMKLDGAGASSFYDTDGIAEWLMDRVLSNQAAQGEGASSPPPPPCVYLKYKSGEEERGKLLSGHLPTQPIALVENGVKFKVDIVQGQKTGFFLDQRDNRDMIRSMVPKGSRMLNLFSYTGGFSVYAGMGGAGHVTSVDIAAPAIKACEHNWALNGLPPSSHTGLAEDVFAFLQRSVAGKEQWDVVVCDPPSFAPNKASVEKARSSYERVFSLAAQVSCHACKVGPTYNVSQVTKQGGMLACASCSSHISSGLFGEICEEAILGGARRGGRVLKVGGAGADHPWPIGMEELRYLKFGLFELN